jgi:hypothetical protein
MKNNTLTWNDLADFYDEVHLHSDRPARTLSMEYVYEWATQQVDKIGINPDGTLYFIRQEIR